MKGKKETVQKGTRPGMAQEDELQLMKLILEENPRLKERVLRFLESRIDTEEAKKKP